MLAFHLFAAAAAINAPLASRPLVARVAGGSRAAVRLFESEDSKEPLVINSVTRSKDVGADREGSIAVTTGGSLYASRTLFTMLHDFGRYASIVAISDDTATAKKALLTRQARYSGLLDVLDFADGEMSESMSGVDTWLAIDADEAAFPAQLKAAADAGVSRVMCLITGGSAVKDSAALEAALGSSGLEYTVMRTGELEDAAPSGGGLKLDDLDLPVCESVAREDVFRFVTEALTLPEAKGRLFSLCPSEGAVSTLKQMRLCGYERREEVKLLLAGLIKVDEPAELTEEEAAEKQELVLRSEAEIAAEREEELKALLAKARARGEATQARLKYEEIEKEAHRKEQEKYYGAPREVDGKGGEGGEGADGAKDDDDKEDKATEA